MANTSNKMAVLICKLRKKANLTQSELAQLSGISFRTMQRIESGEVSPRMDLFFRIINSIHADITTELLTMFKSGENHTPPKEHVEAFGEATASRIIQSDHPFLVDQFEVDVLKHSIGNDFERKNAALGYWEWNVSGNELYWSSQMYKIYGLEMGEKITSEKVNSIIAPEEHEKIQRDIDNLIEFNVPLESTRRCYSQGETFYVSVYGKKYKNSKGELYLFGIAQRVTL
jgi:PAS domain S-box-containing protein